MGSVLGPLRAAIPVVLVVCSLAAWQVAGQPVTASAPTTGPITATAPVERIVQWHAEYKPALEEANRRNTLLLVVYLDPDAPACEAFEERTLRDIPTRRFLAKFAAAKLVLTAEGAKERFKAVGGESAPLTQVQTPEGEVLDSVPGAFIVASEFRERLGDSLAYWRASKAKPFDLAAQWKAIQARLNLSTRAKAVPAVDRLMKLPAGDLPAGVTRAHLHLAKGRALSRTAPESAEKELREARKLGPKDPIVGGEALIALADLALRAKRYKEAHGHCVAYIREFPKGPAAGQAYYHKALVEFIGLDDRATAEGTLGEFISKHPDDPAVVKARGLLTWLRTLGRK